MIKYNIKCHNSHEFESWFSDSNEFDNEGNHDLSIAGASPFGRARSVEVVTNKRRIMAYVVLGVYCPLLLICSTNALWNLLQ